MRKNKIKELWAAKKCATMGWLSVGHSFTAEVMFGQIGETITTLSPGSTRSWQLSRIACMPPVVSDRRSGGHLILYNRSV